MAENSIQPSLIPFKVAGTLKKIINFLGDLRYLFYIPVETIITYKVLLRKCNNFSICYGYY